LTIGFVTLILSLMSTYNTTKVIAVKKITSGLVAENTRTTSNIIEKESLFSVICIKVFHRVGPKNITSCSFLGWLRKAMNFPNIINSFDIFRDSTMYTKKLITYNRGKGEGVERINSFLVNTDFIFVNTFFFECKVLS